MSTCNEMPKYDLVTKAIKPNIEEEKSLDFGKGHIKSLTEISNMMIHIQ